MSEDHTSYRAQNEGMYAFTTEDETAVALTQSTKFPGITEEDVHFHEPLLKNLLEDASKKISDHMFRLKISMEYKTREEMESLKSSYEQIVTEKDDMIHELQKQVASLKKQADADRNQYQRQIELSTKEHAVTTQILEKRISFLTWKHNAEELALQKDMQDLASSLTESNEKSKDYISKLKQVHQSEKDEIVTSLKADADRITKEVSSCA
jgi:hypothetical protein